MPHVASAPAECPRTLRRRSLLRGAWCDADLPRKLSQAVLRGDLEPVLFGSNPLQVKDRCVVAQFESDGEPLLIKRHTWGGAGRTLRMAFREPAARSCARLGRFLHDHGIPTPRPRAYVDCRFGPWTFRSYLISDYVEGESLYRYIRFDAQGAEELRHVAAQVAKIWQQLVEIGVSHNDFKPENFIVDPDRNVWLIDLEKVRLRGDARRQQQRQIFDVKNFLHVRSWHRRAEARALFAEVFLQTRFGDRLQAAGVNPAGRIGEGDDLQIDADLSVIIVCEGGIDMSLARRAIDSVRDIADTILLVEPTESGQLDVVKQMDAVGTSTPLQPHSKQPSDAPSTLPITRNSWELLLHQDECVTPVLAKELQQRITARAARNAFRIPIERQFFGRSIARRRNEAAPLRLLRKSERSHSTGGEIAINAADSRVAPQLTGTIQKSVCATISEFVERLNEETTCTARLRLQQGERPHLGWGLFRAAGQLVRSYLRSGGIFSGWTAVQIAVLDSVFYWVEETKLYQLAAEFRSNNSHGVFSVGDAAQLEDECKSSEVPWSKAA